MRKVRSIILVSIFGSILAMLPIRSADCQWVQLTNFNEAVASVYFLDDVNLPKVGFVGAAGDIFRTVDGGTTWTNVLNRLPGRTTSFSFKDGNTGWCSVDGSTNASSAIYKTANGGASWTPLSPIGTGSDVYYNQTSGLLFLSRRMSATQFSLISADGGTTWSALNGQQQDENGFAFCTPSIGILSSLGVIVRTADGGKTWSGAGIGHGQHSWSPCAVPGTTTFVAATDFSQTLFESTDGGLTWNSIPGIPIGDQLSGCVQPGRCGVYVQTSKGIYVSPTLSGWSFLQGPGNTFDTRFFSGAANIYAGDGAGNIQKFPKSAIDWPTVQSNPPSITLNEAIGCPPKIDSATFQNLSCLPLNILKAWVTDSAQWTLATVILPDTLGINDTIKFHLTATGKSSGEVRSNLELTIQTTAGTTDTSLPLTINVEGIVPPTIKPVTATLRDKCTPLDTLFRIQNNHCDTIRLTSLSMIDTTLFTLGAFTLPIVLAPDSVCVIPVTAKPKEKGTFNDTAAITLSSGNFALDTSVALIGVVPTSIVAATYSDTAIAFGAVTDCQSKFDTVYMKNIACDSAQITLAQIGVFSAFNVLGNILHTWLGPGDSVAIVVELPGSTASGNYADELDLLLDNGAYRQEYPIKLSGSASHSPEFPTFSASSLERDSIPPCDVFDTTITMTFSTACPDSLQISTIQYNGQGNITVTSTPTLPYALHSGDTLTYKISYVPKAGEVAGGNIEIKGASFNMLFDTSLPVNFSSGSNGEGLLSMSAARTALSAKQCDLDSVYIELHNTGCGPITIDSLVIQSIFPGQTQFLLSSVTFPFATPPADSVPIKVFYVGDGVGNGSASVLARETGGNVLTQSISGSTIPTPTVRIGIALTPQSSLDPIAGGVTTAYLLFEDTVQPSSNLLTFDCNITFNGNVLKDLGPVGQNGWSVQELPSTQTGLSLSFMRTNATPITPGDEVATLPVEAFISDSLATQIALASVDFSPNDPNYERCTLAAAIAQPPLEVQINTECGDSDLAAFLRGNNIVISSVKIVPNPAERNGTSELTVLFISSLQAEAAITISDVLGRPRVTTSANAIPGSNRIVIPIAMLDEGIYYIDLSEEGSHVVTRFAVTKNN